DTSLPGMDGFTVARHMQSQPELAGVVLVAMTGYGSEEARRQSAAAGFKHHMVKPVHLDALKDVLADLEADKKGSSPEARRYTLALPFSASLFDVRPRSPRIPSQGCKNLATQPGLNAGLDLGRFTHVGKITS